MAETAYILNIAVRNKIATTIDPATVVNGNNDYTVVFDFDSEWDSLSSKTAMFVYGREEQKYKTVTFTGNSCAMPALYNTGYVLIGVFAGNIKTTSAAYVKCIPCIRDNDSTLDTGSGGTIDTGTTDHSQLINRDIADQHPISAITGLEETLTPLTGTTETLTPTQVYDAIKSGKSVLLQHTNPILGLFTFASFNIFEKEKLVVSTSIGKTGDAYLASSLAGFAGSNNWVFNITEMAEADDIPVAVNNALAQAKESGEFDGAAGKSAYAYAQDGGYVGTEEQFAAKLAKEKFANPYALTFTGAVNETYDGSSAKTIEIPSGGGGGGTNLSLVYENTFENIAGINETIDALNGKENFVFNIEFAPLADSATAVTINGSSLYNGERRFQIAYYLKFGDYSAAYPKKAIYGSVLKLGEGLWERIVLKSEGSVMFSNPYNFAAGKDMLFQYLKDNQLPNRAAGLSVDFNQTVESVKVQIYAG